MNCKIKEQSILNHAICSLRSRICGFGFKKQKRTGSSFFLYVQQLAAAMMATLMIKVLTEVLVTFVIQTLENKGNIIPPKFSENTHERRTGEH